MVRHSIQNSYVGRLDAGMGSRDYKAGSRPGFLAISADYLWKYGSAVDAGIDVQSVAEAITVDTDVERVAGPAEVVVSIDGQEAFRVDVKRTVPAAFTASESFDVGADLGSTVSLDYYEKRPFEFSGEIEKVNVKLQQRRWNQLFAPRGRDPHVRRNDPDNVHQVFSRSVHR